MNRSNDSTRRLPLRLWPGVAIVTVQWFLWLVLPTIYAETSPYLWAFGGLAGGAAVFLWWLFASRARWSERIGALVLLVLGLLATRSLLHESIATGGQGFLFFVYSVPPLCLAFVAWAVFARRLSGPARWATLVLAIATGCGVWLLLRTSGASSTGSDFAWRWSETPEERLLAETEGTDPPLTAPGPTSREAVSGAADWPGFRGPHRDGVVPGLEIATDWQSSPPTELWRQPIGPGWSSFAVVGDLLYTQEQRGDDEVVSCYDLTTGEPVWQHRDAVRFWESNAGAGPRSTPTLHDGRLFSLGATGRLNVLDAADGTVVWTRDTAADSGEEVPTWGFSGSPLVAEDYVFVAVAGRLVAYDRQSGELLWQGPEGGTGYSSPQLVTLEGVEQILLASAFGLRSFAPANGTLLWEHAWEGSPIVQPALTPDGDLLLGSDGVGTLRLAVSYGSSGWTTEERWSSNRLKPNFNDFVVHEGHAYGFDGAILAAIDLATGERQWKGGRYGHGQLVLLADQDLLLVITEKGELALVSATPERFTELARMPSLEGKTWNHPVVVDHLLLVRNGQEMAAYRLPPAG